LSESQSDRKTRNSDTEVSSTCTKFINLPSHISKELMGQHCGKLLLYFLHAQKKAKPNAILGMIIQNTKVSVLRI